MTMNKLASVLLLAALCGCSHGSNGGSAAPPAGSAAAVAQGDPTGFWSGALTIVPTPNTMVWELQLRDTGGQLTGTWSNAAGASGTISGSVVPYGHLIFVMDQTVPCAGSYHGAAAPYAQDTQVMQIYFTGYDCQGSLSVTGTLAW